MTVVVRVLLGVIGAAAVVASLDSAVRSTVLPRASRSRIAMAVSGATRGLFRLLVWRSTSYRTRDRVMALYGPVVLLSLLASWLLLVLLGFTCIYLAEGVRGGARAAELSGSSAFTLGTTAPRGLTSGVLTYSEAGIGLLLLTLLVTYLPSIYAAFSRREVGVNLLRARAGDPPQATTLLKRYWFIDDAEARLGELWRSWEAWFADVEETHTTFLALNYFRSPQPAESWITAAGVLLDSAALWVSAVEHRPDPSAQLCMRTGFLALRRIATSLGLDCDDDPRPTDPISIGRDEWERAVDELAAAGIPVVGNRDLAWRAWSGWRVNYDLVLLEIARRVEAPVAPWTSDRSPMRAMRADATSRRARRRSG
ncbi:MAG: hypothetical protein M0T80_00415 [Actinomycetota bacterium]|nr:hypothetical protein [Actinomycetota bacterium]